MTDEQILQIDFYDLCGCGTLWMTDEEKIKYYREVVERVKFINEPNKDIPSPH